MSTAQTKILEFYPWALAVHQLLSISYSMPVGLAQFVRLAKLMWCGCLRTTNTSERSELEDPTMTFRSTVWERHGFLVSYIEMWTNISGLDEKCTLIISKCVCGNTTVTQWIINRMNTGLKAIALSPQSEHYWQLLFIYFNPDCQYLSWFHCYDRIHGQSATVDRFQFFQIEWQKWFQTFTESSEIFSVW